MEKEAMEAIKLFRKLDVHYLEVGFLEAMWKVLKIVPEEHLDVVALGLDAIRSTYTRLDIPSEAYVEAYRSTAEGTGTSLTPSTTRRRAFKRSCY
ncbi:MAG: hypothetical protein QW650_06550 [Thermofilum sp.]